MTIKTKPTHDFATRLEENPEDWELRLIYADWLEEWGEEALANGQRWQAQNRAKPRWSTTGTWDWWNAETTSTLKGADRQAYLRDRLWRSLKGGRISSFDIWAEYSTVRDAENGLAAALAAEGQ